MNLGPIPAAHGGDDTAARLAQAVELATENVRNAGGPFGAIVVTADGRSFDGVNRVTANLDPTAHAEVTAIRAACQGIGDFDLSGATLYSSCEPCPMCLAAAQYSMRSALRRHSAKGASRCSPASSSRATGMTARDSSPSSSK